MPVCRLHRHAVSLGAPIVLAIGACVLAAPASAQPARLRDAAIAARAKPIAAPALAAEPADWSAREPDARSCARSRRKLWQAGDGWIVKTVTVCQ